MAQPLTKLKKSGERYARPPSVEANVDGALREDADGIRRRLLVTDAKDADYLKSECLVHLARELTRRGEIKLRNAVVMALFVRCEAILKSKIDPSRVPNAKELRETILQEFALLLAGDGADENPDELDFFECRFNAAFRTFRIDIMRSTKRADSHAPLPTDARDTEEEVRTNRDVPSCRAEQGDGLARAALLDRLPPKVREAVILCHEMGYDEESEDPNKITAATLCKVSGRTIRERLKKAREILSQANEDEK
jgi:hypothetical protein